MDIAYLLWWQGLREGMNGVLNPFFLAVTALGEATLPMAVVLGVYWCLNKRQGTRLLFAYNLGAFLTGILKLVFCVYRPWIRDPRITPPEGALSGATGYSFPSGHSTNGVTVYGSLGYENRRRRWCLWCMMALTALILISRNYLGVHTPQDVLVGAALGVAAIWLTGRLLAWAEAEGTNRDLWLALAVTLAAALSLVFVSVKPYPMDLVNGAVLVDPVKMRYDHFSTSGALLGCAWGWVWERRGVRFAVAGDVFVRLLRFVTGMAVTMLLFTVVRGWLVALLGGGYGRLAGAFLVLLYATAVHPLLFTAIEKRWHSKPAARATAPQ